MEQVEAEMIFESVKTHQFALMQQLNLSAITGKRTTVI